jgi:hypothetical protein
MIEIWLDSGQPPTGRVVAAAGAAPQPFAGWLDLLRILAESFTPTDGSASASAPPGN